MILGLQAISLVFALIMLYFSYLHYRRGEISLIETLFLLAAWFGAVLIILFPKVLGTFAESIAISRAFDLGVIGGFILTIPLVYSAYIRTKRLERKLEKFTRTESLKGLKNDYKKAR